MTKNELAGMVSGVKSPSLDRRQTRKLFEENQNTEFQQNNNNQVAQPVARFYEPVAQPVAHLYTEPVAQEVAQETTQYKTKEVAQEVAQPLWVAQPTPQKVAQDKSKQVAQYNPQAVAQYKSKKVAQLGSQVARRIKDSAELLIDKYVYDLKVKISNINGVEDRKKFIRGVGWGIGTEQRKKKYYLYGTKKLSGRKYKLYIGNATK